MRKVSRPLWMCWVACALWIGTGLLIGSGKAQAQSVRADEPAAAGRSYLSGDWGGTRSYLENHGVTFTFSYINDLLANVSGGIGTGRVDLGAFQPQVDIDLHKLVGLQGGRIHIHGLVTHGPFFSETYLGNILAVSNLEAGPVARLYAFWYEQNSPNDTWSIRTGLMLADSQFAQSRTAANFINNGISWPTFLAANLPASGPAYPLPAPGVRVRVKPRNDLTLQVGVFSGDPSGGNGSNLSTPLPTGTVISFRGGTFLIGEVSYLPNQSVDARGLPGAYRFGAWYHSSTHFADQRFDNLGLSLANPNSSGIPLDHAGDRGIYGVIDQMLFREPGSGDQGLSGFIRAGSVSNDLNLVNFYGDAGLVYKGPLPGRSEDKIGIAVAYANIGKSARQLDADTALYGNSYYPIRSGEMMIEAMYQAQLAPWWTLQPDLQYIIRPGAGVLNPDGSLRPNAWVVGLRSSLTF